MISIEQGDTVYDLYCGTGTLGICASMKAKHVIGIDVSAESTLDARTNAKLNNAENVTIITGAIRNTLSHVIDDAFYTKPQIVVVDPPRPGLDPEALSSLIKIGAKKILYVSCNPITQAQNVSDLMEHGYRISAMQLVDQFAHTPHMENVVVLKKGI